MAADLFFSGIEQTTAMTVALIAVLILRRPVRALFGARAAYALWLLVPAAMLAVALPGRIAATAPDAAPSVITAPNPAAPATADGLAPADLQLRRPASLPHPGDYAGLLILLWGIGALSSGALTVHRQRSFISALGVLRPEIRTEGQVFHADRHDIGPALVGAIRPRIVLPGDFDRRFTPEEQAVVVAHEKAHLTSGDAQINLMVALAQAVFWFHPLVPVAARLIRMDQELACDEAVVTRLPGTRRLYAETMLKAQLTPMAAPLACQWPGEGPALRQRIAHLGQPLGRSRRILGAILAATLVAGGGAAAWAAQPTRPVESDRRASASTRALLEAIRDGRNSEAAELIRTGTAAEANVAGEGSPLIIAARDGQLALVRLMLEHGADPDRTILGDGSALIAAAGKGDLAMVDVLLANRADADLPVRGDGSPLIVAASGGHVQIIDRLIAAGAQVNRIVPGDETALINAARQGHLDAVRRLVEAGADVNLAVMAPRLAGPDERRSPLGMARRAGRAEVIDYLIARGARP
jgi:beta-lactamase regulating signal transducer with metallopeptidase domain